MILDQFFGTTRVSGIGLLYTELVQGIPSIFMQFLSLFFHKKKGSCFEEFPRKTIVCFGVKEDHHAFEQLHIQSLEKFLSMQAQERNGLIINGSIDAW